MNVGGWGALDAVLADATAALVAGEDEKAANLFDAAAALEIAIRTTHSSYTIKELNI
jgi:hypothetical protein